MLCGKSDRYRSSFAVDRALRATVSAETNTCIYLSIHLFIYLSIYLYIYLESGYTGAKFYYQMPFISSSEL